MIGLSFSYTIRRMESRSRWLDASRSGGAGDLA